MKTLYALQLHPFLLNIQKNKQRCDLLINSEWALMCLNTVFPAENGKERRSVLPFVALIDNGKVMGYAEYGQYRQFTNDLYFTKCVLETDRKE